MPGKSAKRAGSAHTRRCHWCLTRGMARNVIVIHRPLRDHRAKRRLVGMLVILAPKLVWRLFTLCEVSRNRKDQTMVLSGGAAVVDMKSEVPGEYTLGSCAVAGGSWFGGQAGVEWREPGRTYRTRWSKARDSAHWHRPRSPRLNTPCRLNAAIGKHARNTRRHNGGCNCRTKMETNYPGCALMVTAAALSAFAS